MTVTIDTSDIPEVGEKWFHKARRVLPIRQSELQRAREHLFMRQSCLGFLRKKYAEAKWPGSSLAVAEADVLAGLSWVWDAQERAGLNRDIVTPMRMGPGLVVMFVNKGARGDG